VAISTADDSSDEELSPLAGHQLIVYAPSVTFIAAIVQPPFVTFFDYRQPGLANKIELSLDGL
jgi:hypothetical protein